MMSGDKNTYIMLFDIPPDTLSHLLLNFIDDKMFFSIVI